MDSTIYIWEYTYTHMQKMIDGKEAMNLKQMERGIWKGLGEEKGRG